MILYHGTVKLYLESILREGLKPVLSNRWMAKWPSGDSVAVDEEPGVYLSPFRESAVRFAKGKTRYLRTSPGKKFRFGDVYLSRTDGPVLETSPVVLKINTSGLDRNLVKPDAYDPGGLGLIYCGEIPPEFITEV